jgi:hypothetical protein
MTYLVSFLSLQSRCAGLVEVLAGLLCYSTLIKVIVK